MPRKLPVSVPTLASTGVSEDDEDGRGSETLDAGAGATESENEDEGQSGGEGSGEAPGGFTSVEGDGCSADGKGTELGRLQARSLSEVTDRAQDGVLLRELH